MEFMQRMFQEQAHHIYSCGSDLVYSLNMLFVCGAYSKSWETWIPMSSRPVKWGHFPACLVNLSINPAGAEEPGGHVTWEQDSMDYEALL